MPRIPSRAEIVQRLTTETKWRARLTRLGYALNETGIRLVARGRDVVRFMNRHLVDPASDRFVHGLPALHARIREVLARQGREYGHYAYFYGQPYQALGILGIYGERPTEERFEAYGLADLVGRDDIVLDIGCNCGFVSILTAYRTGCRAEGIDINPFAIEIGHLAADFLGLGERVSLSARRFQDFESEPRFSVVFSFATHWTDDGNYRVDLREHLAKIHRVLRPGGLLVFESHCADVGDPEFYRALEAMRTHFTWDTKKASFDNGTRELYLMRRR